MTFIILQGAGAILALSLVTFLMWEITTSEIHWKIICPVALIAVLFLAAPMLVVR